MRSRSYPTIEDSCLLSALSANGSFQDSDSFADWFESRKEAHEFQVEQIAFRELTSWSFEGRGKNIVHDSGKFFRIEGVRIKTNFGARSAWDQPIINQPEIGILGIISKEFDGIRHFLMQAKMEPGNINISQLSPTVQATRSNFLRVHKGRCPPFLEYFQDRAKSKVIVDQLQTEQGARFLRKRNRNVIVEIEEDIELPDDFCWLTLGQIKHLLTVDNLVNMDARSVLSCVPLLKESERPSLSGEVLKEDGPIEVLGRHLSDYSKDLWISAACSEDLCLLRNADIVSWFTEQKSVFECQVDRIALSEVAQWQITEREIVHESQAFFSVIAVSVQAGSREVSRWTQPMLKGNTVGLVGFLTQKIEGVLHFLVQAKVEAGYLDVIEIVPTVSFSRVRHCPLPPFADLFVNATAAQIRSSVLLSEEGGRFYCAQNRYMVMEVEPASKIEVPPNYVWMTIGQMMSMGRYGNCVSVEARSLLACLNFL